MAITNEQLALKHLKFDVKTDHEHTTKFCMTYLTSKVLMVVTTKITVIWDVRPLVRETCFKIE
jgi:hypothetical protein